MITGCPSCATSDDPPTRHSGHEVSMGRCSACGHRWLEAAAIEVVEARLPPPAMTYDPDLEDEARRIAEAARLAAARHQESRRRRRAKLRGWGMLGLAVVLPLAGALAFREAIIGAAPAAAGLYRLAGMEVEIPGLSIRTAATEVSGDGETPVLVVRGEVVNDAKRALDVPPLRFELRDHTGGDLYSWTISDIGAGGLGPGEATSFVTRVAAPPTAAREVEIRFAHED